MMRHQATGFSISGSGARQRGAALIIGLLLLLVLTLLAVSGMRSASEELIMAGNEQYRQNAFQGAEAGIERAIQDGGFDMSTVAETVTGTVGSVDYTTTITPQNSGGGTGMSVGSSSNAAAAFYYQVASQGTSHRGAQVTTWQGLSQPIPSQSDTFTPNTVLGSGF
jgi:type IV pilus assembly protein PilX